LRGVCGRLVKVFDFKPLASRRCRSRPHQRLGFLSSS
jgi:hypothetical protein